MCKVLLRRKDTLAREGEQVYDNDARRLIANERIEQLRLSSLPSVSPIRLRLRGWLIRARRPLTQANAPCPERPRPPLPHKTLTSRPHHPHRPRGEHAHGGP